MSSPSSSLRGILSTNDDPLLCAHCPRVLSKETEGPDFVPSTGFFCCGKVVCHRCSESGLFSRLSCPFCHASLSDVVGLMKKHAKREQPWAQFHVGWEYAEGEGVAQSDFEAVRWFRKAAKHGHPLALLSLSHCHLNGKGCAVDLTEARRYAERAMSIDNDSVPQSLSLLFKIAAAYRRLNTAEATNEELSILEFLAVKGMREAQYYLAGRVCEKDDNHDDAEKCFALAALQGNVNAAHGAVLCALKLERYSIANFWSTVVANAKDDYIPPSRISRKDQMDDTNTIRRGLRMLRDKCGGCGASLDGKMRLYCKCCKTYCYCGRDCQKLHWNRSVGGHREECKEVRSLKALTHMSMKATGR